jgi:hypothetical protein
MAYVVSKRRLELKGEYWRLLPVGMGTAGACRDRLGSKERIWMESREWRTSSDSDLEAEHSGGYPSHFERKWIGPWSTHSGFADQSDAGGNQIVDSSGSPRWPISLPGPVMLRSTPS